MADLSKLSLDGLRALVDLTGESACLVDAQTWQVLYASSRLIRHSSVTDEQLRNVTLFELLPELDSGAIQRQLEVVAGGREDASHVDLRPAADCDPNAFVSLKIRRVASGEGAWLAVVLETASAGASDESLRREGIDPLTGLADRGVIIDRLSRIIHGDRLDDRRCAVLFVDVDGFKQVNDAHGHLVGDRVLGEVARRLKDCLRARDCVARFGGDEFLVLLERIGSRQEIDSVVRRVQAAFSRPIALEHGEVLLGVSIGAARAGDDGNTPEALIDAADRAMYAAKRATA